MNFSVKDARIFEKMAQDIATNVVQPNHRHLTEEEHWALTHPLYEKARENYVNSPMSEWRPTHRGSNVYVPR